MVPFARYRRGCSSHVLVDRFHLSTSKVSAIQDYITYRLSWMVHHAIMRYTLRGTSSPDQLASCWLLGGSEEWATLYAAAQEVDFDQELWDTSKTVFQDTNRSDCELFFSLWRWQGTYFNGQL